jgi:hypothetical protein
LKRFCRSNRLDSRPDRARGFAGRGGSHPTCCPVYAGMGPSCASRAKCARSVCFVSAPDCIADMIHNTSRRRRALTAAPGFRHAYADD